ncbi:MAG: CopG family transcriptional regulator [Candidatus Dormibacteraeota bacterium]|nr:CopG family transcriptional regulator [Candidatus Dormibacteraeota bacterium]
MRRLQIYIDEAMDEALGRAASRRGASKAAVVREALAKEVDLRQAEDGNPWLSMSGWFSDGGVDDIDDYLYGPLVEQ